MRSILILVHLSLFFTSINAFFPWIPEERCQKDGGCSTETRRQLKDQDALGSDDVNAVDAGELSTHEVSHQITCEPFKRRGSPSCLT